MEYVYADLIRKEKKTIDQIPQQHRDAVRKILASWGIEV